MRKFGIALVISGTFPALLLYALAAHAHTDKPVDRNGGHWDSAGFYHCHLAGCVPAASRHEFRSRAFSTSDMDQYFLEEDWPHWLAPQGGCKDMRTVVLEATSRVPVTWTNPRQCEIREGLWVDEYTGEEFTRAAQLEVDHIISPRYASGSNGYQWDDGKRAQFANDAYNLIPVGRDTARKKRGRGIGDWQPPSETFQCGYAEAWRDVAEKYELDLLARDASRMNTMLASCETEPDRKIENENE
jgi:hypothetical protein